MRRSSYVVWVAVMLAALLLPLLIYQKDSCSQVSPGWIDLSGCEFDSLTTAELDGQWEFYWNRLLLPSHFPLPVSAIGPEYIDVPSQWSVPLLSDTHWERHGYATYRVQLRLPEHDGTTVYGLKMTNLRTSSKLYVNGELLGSSGSPATTKGDAIPRNKPYTVYFQASTGEADIVVQMANFHYLSSGITSSLLLGKYDAINDMEQRNKSYDTALASSLALLGIYFLGLSFQRRWDKASSFFAMLCFCGAAFIVTHSEKLLFTMYPAISYEWFTRIQMVSSIFTYWALIGYLYHVLDQPFSKKLLIWSKWFSIGLALFTLVTGVAIFSFVAYIFFILVFLHLILITIILVRVLARKIPGSFYLYVGIVAALQFILNLFVSMEMGVDLYEMPPIAIPIFVLTQGLFLSRRHSQAYITIKELSRQLKQKDRDKDEFLVKTSHEFKTPLNAIMNIAQSILEGGGQSIQERQQEDLRLIALTARRLSFLVKDILDYEQLKQGRIKLLRVPVDLARAVDVVLEVFRHLYRKTNVKVMNSLPLNHYILQADENRLMQILYNLIDNAYKHTNTGEIRISGERMGNEVWITVADTGRGISPNKLSVIFQDYEQDVHRPGGYSEGLGLGLSITKQLVELHGGRIEVQSVVGEGSRFRFSMPYSLDNQLQTDEVSVEPVAAGGGDKTKRSKEEAARFEGKNEFRILLVDDDYVSLKILCNMLDGEGFGYVSAESGEEALEALKGGNRFDLCIMDVMMPSMSGFELCRVIRKSYSQVELPILIVTAGTEYHFHEAGFAAGANDFILKPYDWNELRARVRTLVQLKRSVSMLVQSEVSMLRAQIKPHFLYNAINTIIWMSKRDVEQTQSLLRELSNFLRGSFDFENREQMITFDKEIQLVRAYLALERARFGDRLSVHYELQAADFMLPPLVIQPLVENAVRHGLMEKPAGGNVWIRTMIERDQVVITIADDGKGMEPERIAEVMTGSSYSQDADRTGIGLQNINRRLLHTYGQSFRIKQREGGGTIVSFSIPWKGRDIRNEH
ncbi:ATP-binding protein [Paenibacillus abyssi]|uniref:hybrid sensor histidine kinase/response regulator n=1 Tax=Paenibacillus abyssi TaxID=1340531 RepID=UPI003616614A